MYDINTLKSDLNNAFKIKDLDNLKYFLGLEIARSKKGIHICQRKYALDILSDCGLLGSKPLTTPMSKGTRLTQTEGTPLPAPESYRRLIGRLLYLTHTRPDLSFSVQQLRQFMSHPTSQHHDAAIRILRYIKHNPAQGLFFPADSTLQLKAFSDSDLAACPYTRRSVTGFCIFIGHSLVSWKSKKQPTVSKFSSEAEYRAPASTVCELQWLVYLLHDLHVPLTSPSLLYCDSQSTRHIAVNSSFHERTKHIELDCHIVREKLQNKVFHLLPVSSNHQLADVLTNPLDPKPFQELISKTGSIQHTLTSLWGGIGY